MHILHTLGVLHIGTKGLKFLLVFDFAEDVEVMIGFLMTMMTQSQKCPSITSILLRQDCSN